VSVQTGDVISSQLIPRTYTGSGLLTSMVALTDLILFIVIGSPSHSE
jgi:hypothetical protein